MNNWKELNLVSFKELEADCKEAGCIKYQNREKKLVFEQHNKKYCGLNNAQKEVLGIHVDDGLIKSTRTSKCDAAIFVDNDICYLIELKGSDLVTACNQISETLALFNESYKVEKCVGRIVCSKANTHKVLDENYKTLSKSLLQIKKNFHINIKHLDSATRYLEEKL